MARKLGRFVVLEGMDGAGTTTQARALVHHIIAGGGEATYTREPSDGVVGTHIRRILRHEVAYGVSERTLAALFAADRLEHVDREIRPALEAGVDVVCDRYVLSSLAYQGVMTGDLEWVVQLNGHAPAADLTVLLDLSESEASRRRSVRNDPRERYEIDDTQRAVADAYRTIAAQAGAVVLDGSGAAGEITQRIVEILEEVCP